LEFLFFFVQQQTFYGGSANRGPSVHEQFGSELGKLFEKLLESSAKSSASDMEEIWAKVELLFFHFLFFYFLL
jgi:hypothetical protein